MTWSAWGVGCLHPPRWLIATHQKPRAFASLQVRHQLVVHGALLGYRVMTREALVDEYDRYVLHLAGRVSLGVPGSPDLP